ncbi:MAG: sigma-70 family RNA polymerase sigma factor [Planctomycetota bacterium]|nr:sigma-70 family RNA polymerase sigma factor [Planctomycetota bacterium]
MRDDRRRTIERAYEHWPAAYGLAVVLLGDHGRAEELCQDTFLRLMTTSSDIDASRPLGGLVLTTLRNLCINELRRTRAMSLDAWSEASGTVAPERDPQGAPLGHGPGDPITQLDRGERRAAVRSALERLSPAWREMVYLRDGLDLPYREIAAIADTTEDVVRTTLSRARARLRELLADHAPEGGTT